MPRPTVLVLGAAGRFGAAAAQAFAAAGWQVLAQQRRAAAKGLRPNVQVIDTPLTDIDALAARARGASVVVHAVNPVYTRWGAELLPLFRQGLAVTERLGARFMLPGNVYNHGSQMPALLSEDTPMRPDTAKGALRVAMEAELQRAAERGLDSVVIRAGDFFGGGSGTWIDQAIAKDLARGKLVYPGPIDRMHAWAYLPDLARAFVAVAYTGGHRGCLHLHFEGHSVNGQDFIAALQEAATSLGLRPERGFRLGTMPWGLIRMIGWINPMMREVARMSYLWRVPHALDGRALQRLVGPLPTTPLVSALRDTLIGLDLGLGSPETDAQVRYR